MDNGCDIRDINEDGVEGYLALPEQPGPGVIVLHGWFGLSPLIRRACDELAGSGFVAPAPDSYQERTTRPPARRSCRTHRSKPDPRQ